MTALNTDLTDQAVLFRHRAVHDALARLSCNMNLCDNIAEIAACLENDCKYLFDYHLLRLCLTGPAGYQRIVSAGLKDAHWTEAGSAQFGFERQAAETGVPAAYQGADFIRLQTGGLIGTPEQGAIEHLWVRPFRFGDGFALTASVFFGGNKSFRPADVSVLKTLSTIFFAKVRSLKLLDEVMNTRNELQHALNQLKDTNKQISELVAIQETVIRERTVQLLQRNTRLSEIAFFNSHRIREPLTRILGLVALTRAATAPVIMEEIMPRLQTSSADLDGAIRDVIRLLEQEDAAHGQDAGPGI